MCSSSATPAPAAWQRRGLRRRGARVAPHADERWAGADLMLKVKEPVPRSTTGCGRARCCSPTCTWRLTRHVHRGAARSGTTTIAYETVQLPTGRCRCSPRCREIAGRLAQVGAYYLMRTRRRPGRADAAASRGAPAKVAVIGAGVSGVNAATIALGLQPR